MAMKEIGRGFRLHNSPASTVSRTACNGDRNRNKAVKRPNLGQIESAIVTGDNAASAVVDDDDDADGK